MAYSIELPKAYNETIQTTQNATNYTEGVMIDKYVLDVQMEICQTLSYNHTEQLKCFAGEF